MRTGLVVLGLVFLAACNGEEEAPAECEALAEACHDAGEAGNAEAEACHEYGHEEGRTAEECTNKMTECEAVCSGDTDADTDTDM